MEEEQSKQPPEAGARKSDLTELLREWQYDPADPVRRVRTEDGREVIQVRLPLGIEQYEIHGRPDGYRPEGYDSWLDYYIAKARLRREARRGQQEAAQQSPRGSQGEDSGAAQADSGFLLNEEDFIKLHEEGLLYYYRYLLFFRIQEYALCARDTRRNLRLANFVSRYAHPSLAEELVQYRPYILRMHFTSRALEQIRLTEDLRKAIRTLQKGKRCVERLPPMPGNKIFAWERTRALASLSDLIRQLRSQLPPSRKEQLQRMLRTAVLEEDYERAAAIRDEIARLEGRNTQRPPERTDGNR